MSKPLTINLPDGRKVQLTQVCSIAIPGLPTVLTGHIVLALTLALLVGIHLLGKAGCQIIFDNDKCDVEFDGNVILRGYKDPCTSLSRVLTCRFFFLSTYVEMYRTSTIPFLS
jgi:hypothetical protein